MSRAVGNLRVDLVATLDKFESVLQRAGKDAVTFGVTVGNAGKKAATGTDAAEKSAAKTSKTLSLLRTIAIATFAGLGVRAVVNDFNDAAETVDKLGKASKRLGVDVGSLSTLRFAAGEAGLDFDTLAKFAGKAERSMSEFVRTGGGPAASAFRRLGVSLTDTDGHMRSIDDVLPDIGRAMAGVSSQAEKLDISQAIFGREGGAEFVTWLEESGGALQNLSIQGEKASRLGVVFTSDQVEKLTEYDHALEHIGAAWLGLRVKIMTQVAPTLTDMGNRLASFVAAVPEMVGNISGRIRDALGPKGVARDDARALFGKFFTAVKDLALVFIDDTFTLAGPFVEKGVDFLAAVVGRRLPVALANALMQSFITIQKIVPAAAEQFFPEGSSMRGLTERWKAWFDLTGAGFQGFTHALADSAGGMVISAGMTGDQIHRLDAASKAFTEDMGNLGGEVGNATEGLFGWSAALAKTSLAQDAVARSAKGMGVHVKATNTDFSDFVGGVKQGFKTLEDEGESFREVGNRTTQDWVRGLSDGIGAALIQSGANFKNFGRAAIGVLGDVSKAAAQAILQFMIMRAVTGIASAAFAPAATPINQESFGGPNAAALAPPTGNLPHGGGMMSASGAIHRAGGGGIPGPRTNLDSVPTMTTPGEYVVNATDAARTMPTLSAINKGGAACIVQVIDQRQSGAPPKVERSRGPDGQELVRVLILDEVGKAINSGLLDKTMSTNFGVQRRGIRRG